MPGHLLSCDEPLAIAAAILVTKPELAPTGLHPAAGPRDGGTVVTVRATGAAPPPLTTECVFGVGAGQQPVPAEPVAFESGVFRCVSPPLAGTSRRTEAVPLRLWQRGNSQGMLLELGRWSAHGAVDVQTADALSAAEGLRVLSVWKHRTGLLRDNGVVRSRRGLSSAGNLFTWRAALETPSLRLASFATPTRLRASELLGYARDAAARALLLKYEPEPRTLTPTPTLTLALALTLTRYEPEPSMDSLPFTHYAQPQFLELSPRSGPAAGGIVAIARGIGFAALSSLVAPAGRPTAPSCLFGSRVGAAAVLDDTRLECTVPWGYGSQRVLVEVSLNGVDYVLVLWQALRLIKFRKV